MTEDQVRELFREMRDEPVPPDSRARVRLAVAGRSESWRERYRRHWKIAAAVLLPACVVLIAMLLRGSTRIQSPAARPAEIAKQAEVPAIVPVMEAPRPRVSQARHVVKAVRRPVRQQNSATVIRIETADPDVVILLVGG
jgi:hypothetical protein